jgi:cell wall-associated NlpC family hydrolase
VAKHFGFRVFAKKIQRNALLPFGIFFALVWSAAHVSTMILRSTIWSFLVFFFISCGNDGAWPASTARDTVINMDTIAPLVLDSMPEPNGYPGNPPATINGRNLHPTEIVAFAKTQIGVPYKYASTDPAQGFDCSGFITYVFNHFDITVPRSSIDFTNAGQTIPWEQSAPGDLILFTGTDSLIREVGHMGIITENTDGKLQFIHSTSGKQKGVTITPFESYYKSRFVKVIRVLK